MLSNVITDINSKITRPKIFLFLSIHYTHFTNQQQQIKPRKNKTKKHTKKLVNTRHTAHHSHMLIMGNVTMIKIKCYNKDLSDFFEFIRSHNKKKEKNG